MALAPGDPFGELAQNPNIPSEVRLNLREQLGLDDPVPIHYIHWLSSITLFVFGSAYFVAVLSINDVGDSLRDLPLSCLSEARCNELNKPIGALDMTVTELVRQKGDDIKRIAAAHGAHNVRVFGSVARQEAGSESDVDLLIDIGSTTSAWFPAGLILDLEELLGHRVDVVTEKGRHSALRDRVLRESVPL